MDKLIMKIVKEVSEKRAQILDDFCKAYIASRWDDYFSKQKKIDFRRIQLVEERKENGAVFYFRLTKGKLPYKKPKFPLNKS